MPRIGISGSFGVLPPPPLFLHTIFSIHYFTLFDDGHFGKFILRFNNMLLVYPSIDLIAYCLSVHSPNDAHLKYFHVGTIMHKDAVNIRIQKNL